jgi:membrane protease YdiL (CAAX protease family)
MERSTLRRRGRLLARLALALAIAASGAALGSFVARTLPRDAGPFAEHVAAESLGIEIFLGLLALAGAMLSRLPARDRLGLQPGRLDAARLGLLVVGTLALSHALDGVIELSGLREQSALAHLDSTLAGIEGRPLALALLGIGLAPGIGEELFCRGWVQRGIELRGRPVAGVLLASLLFGVLHVDPVHAAFASVLGLYLGLAALLAASTRAPIACHAVNNLLAVSVAALFPEAELASAGSTVAGFLVAAACLWAVDRRTPR